MINDDKVLIDTSVWIDYFRRGQGIVSDQLELLLGENRAVLCGIVELEILQGLRGKEHNIVQDVFSIIRYIDTNKEDFIFAGTLLNQLKIKGKTITSSDCLIAALSMRHKVTLFTLDNDFKQIPGLAMFCPDKEYA